jgi:hypothetical protein
MKYYLSTNRKFTKCSPRRLVDAILKNDSNNLIGGLEVHYDSKEDYQYYRTISPMLMKAGMGISIHAPDLHLCLDMVLLEQYQRFSETFGQEITVTLHPADLCTTQEENVRLSEMLLETLCEIVDKRGFNLKLCLENLDLLTGNNRLTTEHVARLLPTGDIGFCWDIGHQVRNSNHTYEVPENLSGIIGNVHLHDIGPDEDHQPFFYGNVSMIRALRALESYDYEGNVVMEFDLHSFKSESSVEGKIGEYAKHITYSVDKAQHLELKVI